MIFWHFGHEGRTLALPCLFVGGTGMCRGVGVQVITFSTKPIISGEKLRLSKRRRYSSFICDFALLWGLLVSKFPAWYDGTICEMYLVSLCYVSRTKLFLKPSSIFSLQEAHDATDLSFDSWPKFLSKDWLLLLMHHFNGFIGFARSACWRVCRDRKWPFQPQRGKEFRCQFKVAVHKLQWSVSWKIKSVFNTF